VAQPGTLAEHGWPSQILAGPANGSCQTKIIPPSMETGMRSMNNGYEALLSDYAAIDLFDDSRCAFHA
jgi:hypothetical protein